MLILPGLLETLELSQSELNDPEAYVLPSLDDPHAPLSFQADRRLWERVKKSINVYGKTPHCFRHTFATRAHRAGVDDKTLQSMGGWKDLATMKNNGYAYLNEHYSTENAYSIIMRHFTE